MFGSFIKLKEKTFKLVTRTVTTKSEEQNVKQDNFIPASGHLMFLKNKSVCGRDVSGQLISIGGTRMTDGRTWNIASSLMSRTLEVKDNSLELGELTSLKPLHKTASHKNKTASDA